MNQIKPLNETITEVAVAITDGYSYVGVKPVFNDEESAKFKIIDPDMPQHHSHGDASSTTVVTVTDHTYLGHPDIRVAHTRKVASQIANELLCTRVGSVVILNEVVDMTGFADPFKAIAAAE